MHGFVTTSREETIRLGEKIAERLGPGDLIALTGELGSGKTTLVKGIAKGLGVKAYKYVNSPSFVIIKEYAGKVPLYHFDVFRLNSLSELDALGLEEYFYGDGICVIEWADKIWSLLPKRHVEVKIEIVEKDKRKIRINKGKEGEKRKKKRDEGISDRYFKFGSGCRGSG